MTCLWALSPKEPWHRDGGIRGSVQQHKCIMIQRVQGRHQVHTGIMLQGNSGFQHHIGFRLKRIIGTHHQCYSKQIQNHRGWMFHGTGECSSYRKGCQIQLRSRTSVQSEQFTSSENATFDSSKVEGICVAASSPCLSGEDKIKLSVSLHRLEHLQGPWAAITQFGKSALQAARVLLLALVLLMALPSALASLGPNNRCLLGSQSVLAATVDGGVKRRKPSDKAGVQGQHSGKVEKTGKLRKKSLASPVVGKAESALMVKDGSQRQAVGQGSVHKEGLDKRHVHQRQGSRVGFASVLHSELAGSRRSVNTVDLEEPLWPRRMEGGHRLALPLSWPSVVMPAWRLNPASVQYAFDVMMERHPTTYLMLLVALCGLLVTVGGFLYHTFRPKKRSFGEDMWAAWGNLVSAREHLRESTPEGRTIGFILTIGGLFCYSVLISTITANIKTRMEFLREGAHSQVMERGHKVIGGVNNHLPTLLRQLSKSQEYAVRDGTARSRKQVVLLMAEQPRKETEKALGSMAKELSHLTLLIRSGSLTSTASFKRVAADNAHSVILLASKDDYYDADADAVASVMALIPLVKGREEQRQSSKSPEVVVEVSKASTARLLHSLADLRVSAVEDLSAKLFVQCCRQPGLVDAYARLLDHNNEVINLRNFPSLSGLTFRDVRRGFRDAIICGILRDGRVDFHPAEDEVLQSADKLMVIAEKLTHRVPPRALEAKAAKARAAQAQAPTPPKPLMPLPFNRMALQQRRSTALPMAGQAKAPASKGKRKSLSLHKTPDDVALAERILILGWRLGVPDMIREYDDYVGPGSELVVLAPESIEEREELISRQIPSALRNLRVVHKVGNPMSRTDICSAIYDKDSLFSDQMASKHSTMLFQNVPLSISVISSKSWRSGGDNSKPDKQSLYSLLLVDSIANEDHIKLHSLAAEFQDKKLAKEVLSLHPRVQYVATSDLMGLVTSQVAEHKELNKVWIELLNSWGDEIYVKDIRFYKDADEMLTFAELAERAVSRKEVAIGYRKDGKVILNPCPKVIPLELSEDDRLIVISEN